jgi:hypothetical protein
VLILKTLGWHTMEVKDNNFVVLCFCFFISIFGQVVCAFPDLTSFLPIIMCS